MSWVRRTGVSPYCKGDLKSVTRLVREFLNELLLLSMYMRLT
jgi:hypothetical protein